MQSASSTSRAMKTSQGHFVRFKLALAAMALTLPEVQGAKAAAFTNTGPLITPRQYHTATLLPNGKVLVAGGSDGTGTIQSAELYEPINGIWTAIGRLRSARLGHTATLLPNGKVLVAGGWNPSQGYLSNAELFDPSTGIWAPTGPLISARQYHTATLLPNGKVLVTGGFTNYSAGFLPTSSAELYDPASGTWAMSGSMTNAKGRHTATLLPNGKVLITGGDDGISNSLSTTRPCQRDVDRDEQDDLRAYPPHGDVVTQWGRAYRGGVRQQ